MISQHIAVANFRQIANFAFTFAAAMALTLVVGIPALAHSPTKHRPAHLDNRTDGACYMSSNHWDKEALGWEDGWAWNQSGPSSACNNISAAVRGIAIESHHSIYYGATKYGNQNWSSTTPSNWSLRVHYSRHSGTTSGFYLNFSW